MYRIDDATAATSLPVPESAGTEGYFTEGDPVAGTPATNVRGSWLNMIQEELCAILAAAGIARSKTSYNQVNAALQKMYSPVIGTARNVSMSVTTASATATLTADEIVVGTALGGQKYVLSSFSKTISLATTGAGGMDTGTAPVSGFVALYAIYNPTTATAALLATNATSAVAPNVYGGANMPSGYTASALVSIAPTNASSQFAVFGQIDRKVDIGVATLLSTGTAATNQTITSTLIPLNAKFVSGNVSAGSTAASLVALTVYNSSAPVGAQSCTTTVAAGVSLTSAYNRIGVPTPQTIRYTASSSAGTATFIISLNAYEF